MSLSQSEKITKLEDLMDNLWDHSLTYGQGSKMLSQILYAIADNKTISYGEEIHLNTKIQIPYAEINNLRTVGVTHDDLNILKQRREDLAEFVMKLFVEMLEAGYRDIKNMEDHIWKAAWDKKSEFISDKNLERFKETRFLKWDLKGFFNKARVGLITTLLAETNLNPQQILDKVTSLSNHGMNKLSEQIKLKRIVLRAPEITTAATTVSATAASVTGINAPATLPLADIKALSPQNSYISSLMNPTTAIYLTDTAILLFIFGSLAAKLKPVKALKKACVNMGLACMGLFATPKAKQEDASHDLGKDSRIDIIPNASLTIRSSLVSI